MNIEEIMNSLTEDKKVELQSEIDTISELLSNGIISEDEFNTLKKKTLESFVVVEFKADYEDSETAEPTGTTAKKRKADVFKSAGNDKAETVPDLAGQNKGGKLLDSGKAMSQTSPRLADKRNVKEELFAGDESMNEETKVKAAALFEAHVAEAVEARVAELEAEYEAKLNEAIADLETKMDEYLDYVVENWLEENEVAIESSAKVAVAESFMTSLKDLFETHNINVEDTELSVVESMEQEIAELKSKLNESVDTIIKYENMISEATREEIIADISEGLSDSQKDRLNNLSEKISYSDMDEFRTKVSTIKEAMIVKSTKAEDFLNEEFEGETETTAKAPVLDERMAGYVQAASKIFRN